MRIKTSKYVLEHLDELKVFLQMENNAQVLKHAVSLALTNIHEEIEVPSEDGFDISTAVLFGDENKYFKYLINELRLSTDYKSALLYLIDNGIHEMVLRKNMAKNNRTLYIKNLLEDKCI